MLEKKYRDFLFDIKHIKYCIDELYKYIYKFEYEIRNLDTDVNDFNYNLDLIYEVIKKLGIEKQFNEILLKLEKEKIK